MIRQRHHSGPILLALALLASPPLTLAAEITFAKDEEVGKIFEFIGKLGNVNVIVDPSIAKQRMSVKLSQVEPLEAMRLVARIRNWRVFKVDEIKGKDTYAIGPAETISRGFEQGRARFRRLSYAKADDIAGILAKGLGKDADVNVEKDPRTNSLVVRATDDVYQKVEDLIQQLDLPVPQVVIDAKIVQVDTNYQKEVGFFWTFGVNSTSDGKADGAGFGRGSILAITEFQRINPNGNFYDSPSTAKGSDIFKFGDFFRGNLFFSSAFAAFEAQNLGRILASPRLLAINGAKAELRIGDKIVFAPSPTQPPEERDTGMNMDITPRVNKDNIISMDIFVEQSTPNFDRGPDRPTIRRTVSKTSVQVRDGEEVLVGGLVREENTKTTSKIPFLGELPLLKYLFTRRFTRPISQEIVILIQPKVVKQLAAPAGEPTGEVPPPADATATARPPDDLGGLDGLPGDLGPGPGPSPPPGATPSPAGKAFDDDLGL